MTWLTIVLVSVIALSAGAAITRARRPARRRSDVPPAIDPFTVGEPWRQFVQRVRRSEREIVRVVGSTPAGPLKDRLATITVKLATVVQETWRIARRGDDIDAAVRRLDPTALQARLAAAREVASDSDADDATVAALEKQLATVERLREQSSRAQRSLQLTQLRVDELVGQATEISVGAGDTDAYVREVDDVIIELDALRQAIDETNQL